MHYFWWKMLYFKFKIRNILLKYFFKFFPLYFFDVPTISLRVDVNQISRIP